MHNGYTETSPNVFHSGDIADTEWAIVKDICRQRDMPVAVFNMQCEYQDRPPAGFPYGCTVLWMNVPDFIDNMYSVAAVDFYTAVGETAVAFHKAGYILWFHCLAGVNRSTTANVAFRILQYGETSEGALAAVRAVRPCINLFPTNTKILSEISRRTSQR